MEKFIPENRFTPVDFDPFNGPTIERIVPTTEAQREVFIASSMGADASCAYNESVSLELTGVLDKNALEHAVVALVQRHEALRGCISADGLHVIIQDRNDIRPAFIDLSAKTIEGQQEELKSLARTDMSTPFDLLNGPVLRLMLVKLTGNDHMFRITGHHVLVDGWSLGIIMADISRLYTAYGTNSEPQLPRVHRFSEYAIAQLDFEKSLAHGEVEKYWLDLFKRPLPRVELPTDRPRPRLKSFAGDRIDLVLEPALVQRLRETATRNGASFVTTLLTCFELFIHKLTGDRDMCVGIPAAGQSDYDMKDLVGHCVNLLALRSTVEEDVTFKDHLKSRRTAVLDAFENQKYTFGTLVRTLKVKREPGHIPLAPVVFNVDMNMDDGVSFADLKHRFISNPRRYEQFELFMNATGNADELVLEWSYNTDLFDPSTINGWIVQFTNLLDRITAQPGATIAELIGDEELGTERVPVPVEWQGTAVEYPADKSVNMLFDGVVQQFPNKVALNHIDQELTYAELHERVVARTAMLKQRGVKPGDLVGLCCERDFGMVEAQLAILRAGAAFVPLDHNYPLERLRLLMDDVRLKVIVTQGDLKDKLPAHSAHIILLDGAPLPSVNAEDHPPLDTPDGAAYIMYTSGSTGKPKGVVVPHKGIVRLVKEQNYAPFGPDAVITQLSNVSFDASTFELWGALLNGGRLVLQPQSKPTLREVTDTIERYGVNIMFITTGLFNVLVDEHVDRLKGLKCILTGGEVMSLPHIRKALDVLGPGVLNNMYGPTENTTYSSFHPINSESDIGRQVPIGKPINNTFLYILDEQLEPVPVGAKGELYCGGDGVAMGYWERPELTAERFLPDPFRGEGTRMYRSGDLVRWSNKGAIEFIGRADDQVKVRGFRIELGEIENAISTYPGVKDRLVMARRDLPGDQQLVAYVVPGIDPETNAEFRSEFLAGLKSHLAAQLPSFMVPAFFVALRALPLNPNGKVDKKLLPLPELRNLSMVTKHVAPRNAIEKALAAIWGKALGTMDLSIHDNFFEVGGHSLLGIQILTQVEQQFGQAIPFNQMFLAPTIAQMAELLTSNRPQVRYEHLLPIQPNGSRIPLFCIHGDEANMFLPKYLGSDQPFYGVSHQGDDGLPIPHRTVESIAARYIAEIKKERPHGPYILCGYSFGGIVAFEIARQFVNNGESVPMVILLDTYAPEPYAAVMRAEQKFYGPLKNLVMRGLVKFYHLRNEPLPPWLRNFNVIDTYDRATYQYEMVPYPGDLTIIKAGGSPGTMDKGWKDYIKGNIQLRRCPGTHFTMISEPHVQVVAQQIELAIQEVMQRAKSVVA
ncbi:MAG: amino acid adenylation domain-containing protein [Flavobacteriales bacterium]|nr:amino acid adenylation domain-containing protein [Flavobacteriales bacterium]